jgi:hypothetical protein
VACRSSEVLARSYRIVVRGSAWEAASCTSRRGTPASKLVESNVPTLRIPQLEERAEMQSVLVAALDRGSWCSIPVSDATALAASP